MMKKALTTGAAAIVALMAFSAPAQAQLGSTGALSTWYTGSPDCMLASMSTYGWTECAGAFSGNNLGSGDPGEANVLSFITGTADGNAGWLTNAYVADGDDDFTDPDGSLSFNTTYTNFVLALKQGSQFSLYYYQGAALNGVNYSTAGVQAGADDDLSHWTLYAGEETVVPEPATLLLLGTGLLGMAAVRRRREDVV